jgi:proteasome accessory factor B
MSRRKTERLLSLVVCLLAARRYLTAEQIRAAVPGYPPYGEAFKRMFERDKDELRELGIPLETGPAGADDTGYLISRHDYELHEITLETDEAAVLSLAARVWRRAELADAAAGGLLKLRAAGVEAEDIPDIEPRLRTDDAAFPAIWQAVRDRRPVTFSYQAVGRTIPQQRHVEPWGVVSRYGRWYMGGHDRDRAAPRVFRLSRVMGPVTFDGPPRSFAVPAGTDVRDLVRSWGGQHPQQRTAVLRVRDGAGYGLRRWARQLPEPPDEPGWDRLEFPFSEVDWLAGHLASFGPDVVVLDPPDLREAVIGTLKAVLT